MKKRLFMKAFSHILCAAIVLCLPMFARAADGPTITLRTDSGATVVVSSTAASGHMFVLRQDGVTDGSPPRYGDLVEVFFTFKQDATLKSLQNNGTNLYYVPYEHPVFDYYARFWLEESANIVLLTTNFHTVNFDANTGSGTMEPQIIERSVETALTANGFTKTGYLFTGWNTAADGSGSAYSNREKLKIDLTWSKTITLYAQWEECTDHQWNDGVCRKCGYTHPHTLTYTADETSVTEICDGCNHRTTASLTLAAPEYPYTGAAITPIEMVYPKNWLGTDKPTAITYTDNVNAGEATGTITVEGKKLTQTFQINPVSISEATVLMDPEQETYTGLPLQPQVTLTYSGITLDAGADYQLTWDQSEIIEPGTYGLRIEGKGNFTGERDESFQVDPASFKNVQAQQEGALTYDGQPHQPTISIIYSVANDQPASISYNAAADGTYGEIPSFETAGEHTVYYKLTAPYHNTYTGEVVITIDRRPVEIPTIASKIYNGAAQTADITDTADYTVTQNNGGTNAGTYDVILTLNDAENYCWTDGTTTPMTVAFSIDRRPVTVTAEDKEMVYGTEEPALTYVTGQTDLVAGQSLDGALSREAGDNAGTYEILQGSVTNENNPNYDISYVGADFVIHKAQQAAPTGLSSTAETISKKADGTISGATAQMEYRYEDETMYTGVNSSILENLAAGTYYVRLQETINYEPSEDTAVTVGVGRKLTITVPTEQVGYKLTSSTYEADYNGNAELTFILNSGYSKTDEFAIRINGDSDHPWNDGKSSLDGIKTDVVVEVEGVEDLTPPTAQIAIGGDVWSDYREEVAYDLCFNTAKTVAVTAGDEGGSGVALIDYFVDNIGYTIEGLEAVAVWQAYTGSFQIEPNGTYVVYARVTDEAGLVTYVNSDAVKLDNVAPTLEGIVDGETYYGDLTVIKSEEQFYDIERVTLDGEPMAFAEGTYGRITADNGTHTVIVMDRAGNKTTYVVTVMKNYLVTFVVDGETVDTQLVGHGKDATLPEIPEKKGHDQTDPEWDSDGKNITGDTEITAIYTANTYTVTFKTGSKIYKTITCKYGKTIKMPDPPKVRGYTVKWDTTVGKVTKDITVKAVYINSSGEETMTPPTGDNSWIWLWTSLLLASGACLTVLSGYRRKAIR